MFEEPMKIGNSVWNTPYHFKKIIISITITLQCIELAQPGFERNSRLRALEVAAHIRDNLSVLKAVKKLISAPRPFQGH